MRVRRARRLTERGHDKISMSVIVKISAVSTDRTIRSSVGYHRAGKSAHAIAGIQLTVEAAVFDQDKVQVAIFIEIGNGDIHGNTSLTPYAHLQRWFEVIAGVVLFEEIY